MKHQNYHRLRGNWGGWLLLLSLLLSGLGVQAQSGPVGNEWIVPGQQYYKIKIVRDGLYKLDYQYLTQAGISGVAPSQLQIWRRGQELARYVGGNTATLDPTTFVEFYATHNDGRLDVGLYKQPQDQPHQLLNFYTDTASYFITWSVGAAARPGRAMAQPTAAGGAVQPYRLASALYLHYRDFKDRSYDIQNPSVYLPWIEPGEGFFWIITADRQSDNPANESAQSFNAADSTLRSISSLGPAPTVEVGVFGVTEAQHFTEVSVVPPSGPQRVLGVIQYSGYTRGIRTFPVQRSDFNSAGKLVVRVKTQGAVVGRDFFALTYVRVVTPQKSRWFPDRSSTYFKNDSLLAGPATYELDSIPASVVGFDVHDFNNVQRIVSTAGAGNARRFVFPGATGVSHKLALADEAHLLVPPLRAQRIYFRQINPATPNFIIITHPLLMKPAPGTTNAAKAYASYRANPGPGVTRYDTLLVTTFQLYDQFNYGDRSWLAMRRFGRWMAAATPNATNRYLLLLGKGIVPALGETIYRYNGEQQDLVPTASRSVSDNMITADFENNDFSAKLNTGRLTVLTPAQIMAYLGKLQQYDRLGDQTWRKNVLHLVGGSTPAEGVRFRNYMDAYKQHVERPLFGGKVTTVERNTSSTALYTSLNIDNYLTSGLGLISYFGHGSNTTLGIDLGRVDGPDYSNPNGKYPVMLYNGCAAGHLYTAGNPTFFENWLFTPGKGSIGAMGQYNISYEDVLDPPADTLYHLLFNNPQWYGKPITAVYNEAVRRLQQVPNTASHYNPFYGMTDVRAVETLLCTIWHGDPTISLYAPPKPDFQVSNATLNIVPAPGQTTVSATSTSFQLNIGMTNPGKVTYDSVEVRVTRTYDPRFNTTTPPAQPSVRTYKFAQALQGNATYSVLLPNPVGVNVFGINTFLVELDYANKVDESNENNNSATITYTFLRSGLTILNPTEFAIVGNNRPNLVVQTNDPNGPQRVYEFEADTTTNFSSRIKMQSGPVTSTLTASWRPTLPSVGRDSVVWYWRVRFQTPAADEDPNWLVSSFRIIQGRNAGGWSQSHYAQFRRDDRQGVEVAVPTGRWDFSPQKLPLRLRTQGGGQAGAQPTFGVGIGYGIFTNSSVAPTVANCGIYSNNLMIAVYDEHTLQPITGLPAPYTCGLAPQQFYMFANAASPLDTVNTLNGSAARRAELVAFLSAVPDGAYVAVISMNRLRWASLTTVRAAFTTMLGSQLINQLQNGAPFTLLAQKRASGGRLIRELGPQVVAPTIPPYDQIISMSDTLQAPSTNGVITSTRIGPAQSWDKLYHWIKREPGATSNFTLKVIGISANNQSTVLATVPANSGRSGFALNTISAANYPYLQLQLTLKDSLRHTAPQLKEWFVTYQGVPEGVVRRDLVTPSTAYDAATLTAQAQTTGKLKIPVVFQNVTPFDFGTPLRAKVEVRNSVGTALTPVYVNAPSQLMGDSTITINAEVPFVGNFDPQGFTAKVTVNPTPNALPEINLFNNELNIGLFPVVDMNVPPVLDVAFDGRHILNGELVSPRPVIIIQLNDEDKLRHITDRSAFVVTLRKPGANSTATLVDLNSNEVQFSTDITNGSVAKLTYEPGKTKPLDDGVYTLRVQGRDPSNTTAGAQDFQVNFEVVNASQITNVYPYPNPVINKARFVFTLTGQQLPRNMKIQILSLTGRVVREIFMNELGPLHIGNNITDFAWDGTDTYGDRLANGTYLYRVALDDAESQFSHRATSGDKAFKNDWGKLVLMR
ncbi:putative type IX secretion system sortase PorU2 [Hymenobacter rubidus]|uniref:putative type IX secretion system sortase PorU2 n=1 Tax=Hymenobacter rubidus TaxID=1441626 RepID=UPI00191F44D8|nr:C25 family cysteine peptidase [Hymenobacter rubidus]